MAVHFIRSEKNKMKLYDKEHNIHEKNEINPNKTKVYWRCESFYRSCRARVHTRFEKNDEGIIYRHGSHNHPANSAKVEAREAVNELKNKIKICETISTREGIATTWQTLSKEAKFQLQRIPSLLRSVRNWKHKNLRIPANPTS